MVFVLFLLIISSLLLHSSSYYCYVNAQYFNFWPTTFGNFEPVNYQLGLQGAASPFMELISSFYDEVTLICFNILFLVFS